MCNCPAHWSLTDCTCHCDHTNDRLRQWTARARDAEAALDRVRAAVAEHRTSQGPAGMVPVWALERALNGGEG